MAHEVVIGGTTKLVVNDANNIVSPGIIIPGLAKSIKVDSDIDAETLSMMEFPSD